MAWYMRQEKKQTTQRTKNKQKSNKTACIMCDRGYFTQSSSSHTIKQSTQKLGTWNSISTQIQIQTQNGEVHGLLHYHSSQVFSNTQISPTSISTKPASSIGFHQQNPTWVWWDSIFEGQTHKKTVH